MFKIGVYSWELYTLVDFIISSNVFNAPRCITHLVLRAGHYVRRDFLAEAVFRLHLCHHLVIRVVVTTRVFRGSIHPPVADFGIYSAVSLTLKRFYPNHDMSTGEGLINTFYIFHIYLIYYYVMRLCLLKYVIPLFFY